VKKKIILIEFDAGGHPFRVETLEGRSMRTYDFNWCKRDATLYYYNSGSGPDTGAVSIDKLIPEEGETHNLWIRNTHQTLPLDLTCLGWTELDVEPPDPFEGAEECETVFCSACMDELPNDRLCTHVWWCDTDGWYRGAYCDSTDEGRSPCKKQGNCFTCTLQRRLNGEMEVELERGLEPVHVWFTERAVFVEALDDEGEDVPLTEAEMAQAQISANYKMGGYT